MLLKLWLSRGADWALLVSAFPCETLILTLTLESGAPLATRIRTMTPGSTKALHSGAPQVMFNPSGKQLASEQHGNPTDLPPVKGRTSDRHDRRPRCNASSVRLQ